MPMIFSRRLPSCNIYGFPEVWVYDMTYKDWLAFVGVRVQHCIAFSLERLFDQTREVRFLLVKPCIYIFR